MRFKYYFYDMLNSMITHSSSYLPARINSRDITLSNVRGKDLAHSTFDANVNLSPSPYVKPSALRCRDVVMQIENEKYEANKTMTYFGCHPTGRMESDYCRTIRIKHFLDPWCSFTLSDGSGTDSLEEAKKQLEAEGLEASFDFIADVDIGYPSRYYSKEILNSLSPMDVKITWGSNIEYQEMTLDFIAEYRGLFSTPTCLTLASNSEINGDVSKIFSLVPTLKHLFIEKSRSSSMSLDDLPLDVLNHIDSLIIQTEPRLSEQEQVWHRQRDFQFLSKRDKPFKFLSIGNLENGTLSKLRPSFFYDKAEFCSLMTLNLGKQKFRLPSDKKLVIINIYPTLKDSPKSEREYAKEQGWDVMGSETKNGAGVWRLDVLTNYDSSMYGAYDLIRRAYNGSRWLLKRMAEEHLKLGRHHPYVLHKLGSAWMGYDVEFAEDHLFQV